MRRILVWFLVCLQLISLLSVNVFAYTVDDVRDLLGKERVDDKFTQSEINAVISQYSSIEALNQTLRMFEIGKEIDINSELIAEYDRLEKELKEAIDIFANHFQGGSPLSEVLASKSKVESILHKIDSLRDLGMEIDVEYIPNVWTDKYEEVQEVIAEMNSFYDIGEVGEQMRVPYVGRFTIYSPFGTRLNMFTYDSIEVHNGIDFLMEIGTAVRAQWNGVVSKIYTTETGGKTIEISHGNNLTTIYGHLGDIYVVVGERVNQYDRIAKTGNTGEMVKPHLHFGVMLDGEYVNPIYLYGSKGLNAFKTYASTFASSNLEAQRLENEIKEGPSKVVEEVEPTPVWATPRENEAFDIKEFYKNLYGEDNEEEIENDNGNTEDKNENIENNSA